MMKRFRNPASLLFLILVLLYGCFPAQTESGQPPDLVEATSTLPLPVQTATPAPTATPLPASTPAVLADHYPVMEIAFQNLAVENGDGTCSHPFFEGDEGSYNVSEMPSYIWHVNPYTDMGITNIIVDFDVYETAGELVSGYEKGALVSLYYLVPNPDNSVVYQHGITRLGVLRSPRFGEWMDRYLSVQSGPDGVRHHTVAIPYEQFMGGKTELVVQFFPGTRYTEPVVTIEGFDLEAGAVMAALASTSTPTPLDHSWMDVYIARELELDMPEDSWMDYFSNNRLSTAVDVPYQAENVETLVMPAADYGLEDAVSGDFVLVPEGVGTMEFHPLLATGTLFFMRDHMLDPETGLVHGVWDFSANNGQGALVETDRVTSNILLASDFRYGDERGDFQLPMPESKEFLEELLINAIDREIVLAPNGLWVYAPGGMSADGEMVIELKHLSVVVHNLYKELRHTDLERADRLLEGFANTFQLVFEAQEQTPANLVSSTIKVIFADDGNYTFEYLGDFDMGDHFYFSWSHIYNNYSNFVSEVPHGEIFNIGMLEYVADMNPDAQVEKLREMKENAERYGHAHRISVCAYMILYNTYIASDGNYAQYYSLDDRTPVSASIDGAEDAWSDYQQHYGSIGSVANWLVIAAFFSDQEMLSEVFPLLPKGLEILSVYAFEVQFANPDDPIFPQHTVWLAEDGFGLSWDMVHLVSAWSGNGIKALGGSNVFPWDLAGSLGWRVTLDEHLAWLEEHYDFSFEDQPAAGATP